MSIRQRGPAQRPPMWQWLAAAGLVVVSIAAGVTSEVIADQFGGDLGALIWFVVGLAIAGAIGLAVLADRARKPVPEDPYDPVEGHQPDRLPHSLPAADGFIGRASDLDWIVTALSSAHAVAVVGRHGIGTSSCVIAAANRLSDEYPDRPVYLNLRYQGRSMRPRAVLVWLAGALGTPPPRGRSPAALRLAADAVWHRLSERRMLLVLNNVDSPTQVAPLLPPRGLESRLLLAGGPELENVEHVTARWLAEPTLDEAVELFARASGRAIGDRRSQADPRRDPVVRQVVELCGRQPRAVQAMGYYATLHGRWYRDLLSAIDQTVTILPYQRLSYAPVLDILASRDVAYHALSPAAQRVYRRLSIAPGPLDHAAIATVTGLPGRQVERVLEELAMAAFIRGEPGDRYGLRGLLAPLATLHLHIAEPRRQRTAAYADLLRHLARKAERQAANLDGSSPVGAYGPAVDEDPEAWFEREQDLLRALVTRSANGWPMPRPVRRWWFRLAVGLCEWYAHAGQLDAWAEVCRAVLMVPAGDPQVGAWANNELGVVRRRQGDLVGAEEALQCAVDLRGRRGAAQYHLNLGLVLLDLGRLDDAIYHLQLAWRHRSRADRAGRALTDLSLGVAHLRREPPEPAYHHLVRAANAFRALEATRGYAAALSNLGLVQWQLGEYLDANQSWTAALEEYDTIGDPHGRAAVLLNLGAALVTDPQRQDGPALAGAMERARRAYELLRQSRRLREAWPPTAGLGRTLLYLGDAADRIGRPTEAQEHWADAAGVCEQVGDTAGAAEANSRGTNPPPDSAPSPDRLTT